MSAFAGGRREKSRENDYWLLFEFLVFYCRRVADGGIALKAQPWLALIAYEAGRILDDRRV